MISQFLDSVFGCRHNHYSFPITLRSRTRSQAAALTGTYVACLDCGRDLPYDWDEMRVLSSSAERRDHLRSLAAKQAA